MFVVVIGALGIYKFKFKLLAHPLAPKTHVVIILTFYPFASFLNHSLPSLLLITTLQYFAMIFTNDDELSVVLL
jgi:hypothetical protein